MPTLFLHFFLFLFTTTVTNLIAAVHSNCIEAQKQSLLHFKKSLEFDSSESSKLITWNSTTDCCSWLGVTCSTNGRVVGLDLRGEYFSCTIDNSSRLFQLQHLQSLNLAYNHFNGSAIPSAIGKLANLRFLNLSGADFFGQIPIEVARLTRLKVLDLSGNYFSEDARLKLENPNLGTLIQNLTELTDLNLDSVDLSAEGTLWGQTISSSLPKLSLLNLSYCDLSGPIHESLVRLHSLSMLVLDDNYISGPVPKSFANFSSLVSLSLSACNLYEAFPKEIFQIPSLQSVDLSDNSELRGSLPEFPKNGSLESLVLSRTKFSGVLPDSIGNLKMLSELDLGECNFTGAVPKSLANLTQLGHLYLSSNEFSSPINSIQWDKLIKLVDLDLSDNLLYGSIPLSPFSIPLLQRLDLSGNHFSGQLLEFSNVSSYLLDELDLSSNNLEGSIPVSIFNLPGLQEFNLSSNNLSGFPFYGLPESRNLSSLDLSFNSLLFNHNGTNSSHPSLLQIKTLKLASNKLKTFPNFLKNLSYLTELDLSDNQIPGQIPNWIWELHLENLYLCCNKLVSLEAPLPGSTYHLMLLDLHSNQIQGQIPLFLSGNYLDYSRNNFSSSMPIDIGEITNSTGYLSLSSSNLYGEIPKSICSASNVILDLSNNSLRGTIPQCLTQTSLSVLDLRRNNLTGSIPDTFLEGCPLVTLALGRNQIQGQFPKSLANCSSLEVLDLGINQITDAFPCPLKTISTLRVFVLRSNKFYGPIGCPETKETWTKLQIINLANNSFNGEIPGTSLTTWQAMVVNEDGYQIHHSYKWVPPGSEIVSSAGPAVSCGRDSTGTPCHNSSPRSVITSNALTAVSCDRESSGTPCHNSPPEYYSPLNESSIEYADRVTTTSKGLEMDLVYISFIFTSIDFSANKFNGTIPMEMGQLRSLRVLNLSSNAFTGEIPSSFGNMGNIESLDLSQNYLSGQIPPQFANLNFLSYLNV